MKAAVNKSEPIQSKEKSASNQKGIGSVLQAYKEGMTQLQSLEKEPVQRKPNNTGLPDNLKSGIENLSGYSMDDVKVHYNSSQPATLQAHAYAQGTDIHVAPGQEKHLAHEAWHVVQQKQGRVKPTMQMKGTVPVNDDAGLEKEADVMGAKALQMKSSNSENKLVSNNNSNLLQLKSEVVWNSQQFNYLDRNGERKTKEVGGSMTAMLDPDTPIKGANAKSTFQKDMYDDLKLYWNPGAKYWVRGHLLNANLGGPNVAPNLFPITGHANGDHLNYVENHVKNWIIGGKKVKYSVIAKQETGDVTIGQESVPNAAGSLNCQAEIIGEDKKISRLIKSEPVQRPSKNGAVLAGHTSSWQRNEFQGDNQYDKLFIDWTEDQLKFTLHLINNNFNYRDAISSVPITLDELGAIHDTLNEIKSIIENESEDHDLNDGESSDTQTDTVGSQVINAALKEWLQTSFSDSKAEEWLTAKRDSNTINEYKYSS
ncbi:hypothetical protein GCM10009118_02840 [Wandonia haliotis]|uniref:eCIS core domain-containing protein n=1 Tax=Wandonia haliotis TaxID=574963 RepID=A0ABN1MKX5_9FLAO